MGKAQSVAAQPYQPYPNQMVADLTPSQNSAFGAVDQAQGIQAPFLASAAANIRGAPSQYNLGNIQNYAAGMQNPAYGAVAAASQGYTAGQVAQNAATLANPYAGMIASNMGGVGFGQLNNNTQQLMNPYTQDVVHATQANINENNAQQQQQVIGNAVSSGAWGGDRQAVAQSELARQQALASEQTIAGINQAGYTQAQNTASQIGQFNASQGLQGSLALGQLANQEQQMGAGIAQGSANLGLLGASELGTLGAQSQSNALNLANMNATAGLNSGVALGNLGNTALQGALTGASAQMQSGAAQQAQNQNLLNASMSQWQQAQQYPFQSTGFLANIAQGIGSQAGGTTNATVPNGNLISQVGGLGLTGLGLYNSGLFGSAAAGSAAAGAGGGLAAALPLLLARGGRIHRDFGGSAGGSGSDGMGGSGGGMGGFGGGDQSSPTSGGFGGQGGGGSPFGGSMGSPNLGFASPMVTGNYAPSGADFAPVNGGLVGDTGLTGRQYGIINQMQSLNPGMPNQGIAAQLGNFNVESAAKPGDLNTNAINQASGAFGIAQDLSSNRQNAMLSSLGIAPGTPSYQLGADPFRSNYDPNAGALGGTMNGQLSANNADLNQHYPGVASALMNPNSTLSQNVNAFGNGFEAPGKDAQGNVLGYSTRLADAGLWGSMISAAGPHVDANVTKSNLSSGSPDGSGGAVTLDSPANSSVSWSAVPPSRAMTSAENLTFNPNTLNAAGNPASAFVAPGENSVTAGLPPSQVQRSFIPASVSDIMAGMRQQSVGAASPSGLASIGQSPSGLMPAGNQNYSYNNTQVQPSFSTKDAPSSSVALGQTPATSAPAQTALTVPGPVTTAQSTPPGQPLALQGSQFLGAPTGMVGKLLSAAAAHGGTYSPAGGGSGANPIDLPPQSGTQTASAAGGGEGGTTTSASVLPPYVQPPPKQIAFGLGAPTTSTSDARAMYLHALGLAARGGRIQRDAGGSAGDGSDGMGGSGGGMGGFGGGDTGSPGMGGFGGQGGGGSSGVMGSLGSGLGSAISGLFGATPAQAASAGNQWGSIPTMAGDMPTGLVGPAFSPTASEEKMGWAAGASMPERGFANQTPIGPPQGFVPGGTDYNPLTPGSGYSAPSVTGPLSATPYSGMFAARGGRIGRDAGGVIPYAPSLKLPYGQVRPPISNPPFIGAPPPNNALPYGNSGGLGIFNGSIQQIPVGHGIGMPSQAPYNPSSGDPSAQINALLQQYSQGKKFGAFARGGLAGGGANVGDVDAPPDADNSDLNANASNAMQYAPSTLPTAAPMPSGVAPAPAPSADSSQNGQSFAPSQQDKWLSIAAMGAGMMASHSAQPLQAMGEGTTQALTYLSRAKQQARENASTQSEIAYRKGTLGIESDRLVQAAQQYQSDLKLRTATAASENALREQQAAAAKAEAFQHSMVPSPMGPLINDNGRFTPLIDKMGQQSAPAAAPAGAAAPAEGQTAGAPSVPSTTQPYIDTTTGQFTVPLPSVDPADRYRGTDPLLWGNPEVAKGVSENSVKDLAASDKQAATAQNRKGALNALERDMSVAPADDPLLQTGAGAEWRMNVVKHLNAWGATLGLDPVAPQQIANLEDAKKQVTAMTVEQNKGLGREPGYIFDTLSKGVPNIENTPLGNKMVIASQRAQAQQQIDFNNFQQGLMNQQRSTRNASQQFARVMGPEKYTAEANMLMRVDPNDQKMLTIHPKMAPMFDKKYGMPGLSRYFVGQ